jgi:hypothetical protein
VSVSLSGFFRLLFKLHQAEFAKDTVSRTTESSRSNLMAVRHTVKQGYGSVVEIDVTDLVKLTAPATGRIIKA